MNPEVGRPQAPHLSLIEEEEVHKDGSRTRWVSSFSSSKEPSALNAPFCSRAGQLTPLVLQPALWCGTRNLPNRAISLPEDKREKGCSQSGERPDRADYEYGYLAPLRWADLALCIRKLIWVPGHSQSEQTLSSPLYPSPRCPL